MENTITSKLGSGQLIYYSDKEMKCFRVESYEDITYPPDQIEITTVADEKPVFLPATLNPTTVIITGKEIVQLDPTTMRRIAKYNLEQENESLLKDINQKREELAELQGKEDELRKRFAKAINIFSGIMENGYEEDDGDEWFEDNEEY